MMPESLQDRKIYVLTEKNILVVPDERLEQLGNKFMECPRDITFLQFVSDRQHAEQILIEDLRNRALNEGVGIEEMRGLPRFYLKPPIVPDFPV